MTVIDTAAPRVAAPHRAPAEASAIVSASTATAAAPSRLIDPTPVAVGLLAMQLAVFAIRWIGASAGHLGTESMATALAIATLVAGGAQLLAGVVGIVRGDKYVSHVAAVVGLWMLGLYFLTTDEGMEPASVGWYNISLAVLLVIFMAPAVAHRMHSFVCALGSISAVLLLSGLGFLALQSAEGAGPGADLSTAAGLLNASGWLALIGAASLLWIMAKTLYAESGLFGAGSGEQAGAPEASA